MMYLRLIESAKLIINIKITKLFNRETKSVLLTYGN